MGFTDCLVNGVIVGALVLYKSDGVYIEGPGVWVKATWREVQRMWSINY